MIQFSTHELNLQFLENAIDDPSLGLSKEDELFFNSIKQELNQELRQPHPSTIEIILEHSKKLSS